MWCPKKCDLLVTETSLNFHEFRWNLKGAIFFLFAVISAYIFFSKPQFVSDIMPVEIPVIFFGIVALLCLIISTRFWAGTVTEYVCPSCKGAFFDINRFKIVINGKVTKSSIRKHDAILDILNDSSKISDLQCPSCSKDMNSVKVLYKIKHDSQAGNFILEEVIEGLVDSVMAGEKEMQVEGCKSCKSLWLDKTNRMYLGAATILSNKKSRVVVDRNL